MLVRIKLEFDELFGIAKCWYLIDSKKVATVDQLVHDLMHRFAIKELSLEMDGFKFLGDGETRLLFRDNDQIHVRGVSRKRFVREALQVKRIKMDNDFIVQQRNDNNENGMDFVDSADEYCSASSHGSGYDMSNSTKRVSQREIVKSPDVTSFHLSVNAHSAIQDHDSSDATSEVEEEFSSSPKVSYSDHDISYAERLDTVEKSSKNRIISQKENVDTAQILNESDKEEDKKINETKNNCDKRLQQFFKLANVMKDMCGMWISGNDVLKKLPKRFFEEYGYQTWKKYLEYGEKLNCLEFRTKRSCIEIRMTPEMCHRVFQSQDISITNANTLETDSTHVPQGLILTEVKEKNSLPHQQSQKRSNSELKSNGSPDMNNYINFQSNDESNVETASSIDHNSEKDSKWGINDPYIIRPNFSEESSIAEEHIISFDTSESLIKQYQCFIDLAKYCGSFAPNQWIPGNDYISKNPQFYLKYGQNRWKTYLEWGKKLRILDFRIIKGELNFKMPLEARQMILSLPDPTREQVFTAIPDIKSKLAS